MYPKCAHFNDNLNRSFTLTWRGHKTAISENDDDDVVPPLPPFSLHSFFRAFGPSWDKGGRIGGQSLSPTSQIFAGIEENLALQGLWLQFHSLPNLQTIQRPWSADSYPTTYLFSNTFFMGEFSIFFFHPPFKISDYLLIMAFLTKNKQFIDTSSKATKINFLHGGNLFHHFYFLFVS